MATKAILNGKGNIDENLQGNAPTKIFSDVVGIDDTKIDPRGGHLTINKGGRPRRKSCGGGTDRRTMPIDDDDDGCIAPERRCLRLRMRTLWQDNNWHHCLPPVNVAGIRGVLCNEERWWAMMSMKTKQQQQQEES